MSADYVLARKNCLISHETTIKLTTLKRVR